MTKGVIRYNGREISAKPLQIDRRVAEVSFPTSRKIPRHTETVRALSAPTADGTIRLRGRGAGSSFNLMSSSSMDGMVEALSAMPICYEEWAGPVRTRRIYPGSVPSIHIYVKT